MRYAELRHPRRTVALVAGGVLAVGAGVGLVACASDGSGTSGRPAAADASGARVTVVDPYIPQPVRDGMAAGYLVLRNDGGTPDRLVSVTTDIAPSATLHQTVDNRMQQVDGIDIPAHGSGVLGRGGAHIMFEETTRPLKKGDTVDVTLTFEKSAPITVRVPVLGIAERPGDVGGSPGSAGSAGEPGAAHEDHTGHGG
ncbi:copper chaperone PCu(A)C [Yinghuangia sp. YIM S09857]|uniref:copper chaperone PCu(A)C n=1 Tax=Yinghuangia sp. YIM S09857 TaxID=3436929 RepID=UPI003F53824F